MRQRLELAIVELKNAKEDRAASIAKLQVKLLEDSEMEKAMLEKEIAVSTTDV